MKKIIVLLIVLIVGVVCFGQEKQQTDSYRPRFKMYQTENVYNLLKLDTRTGQVWQVQYKMRDVVACTVQIYNAYNYSGIIKEDDGFDGRFELYPTKNVYTFILLDTYSGETYQVQWNTDPEKRFITKL